MWKHAVVLRFRYNWRYIISQRIFLSLHSVTRTLRYQIWFIKLMVLRNTFMCKLYSKWRLRKISTIFIGIKIVNWFLWKYVDYSNFFCCDIFRVIYAAYCSLSKFIITMFLLRSSTYIPIYSILNVTVCKRNS